MREQRNKISFRGQKIYVGIDVHLKSWSVTVLSETSVLKILQWSTESNGTWNPDNHQNLFKGE